VASIVRHLKIDPNSLTVHLILNALFLVLLTSVLAGLPALVLISRQLDQQAWNQVEQGLRASQALFSSRQDDLIGLATLTAQRPTISALLLKDDRRELAAYLEELRLGAALDEIMVCSPRGEMLSHAGDRLPTNTCLGDWIAGYQILKTEAGSDAFLLAFSPIAQGNQILGDVIVGRYLDHLLAITLRDQTGLEHTLFVEGEPVATSFSGTLDGLNLANQNTSSSRLEDAKAYVKFLCGDIPYYASEFSISEDAIHAQVALDVSGIASTRKRLIWSLAGGILAVMALGSFLGTGMARRIGSSLAGLTEAAKALRAGDLDTPVEINTRVRDTRVVAQALESARVDLQKTLSQLRLEKAWSDQLLNAIVEGIITLDSHGQITYFSTGAERITGIKQEDALGQSCDTLFQTPESDEPFSAQIPAPGHQRRIVVQLAGGEQASISVTGARLAPTGASSAEVVLVFRDISEQEAVHLLLGYFLANVSHEFRTPLSALAASIELLLDQAQDLSHAEFQELLVSLHLGVLGLQTLVDNLLESASIEAGHFRVSPRPADLAHIIGESAAIMQPLLLKRNQTLFVELPASLPIVETDPKRASQVMINLLSNASKYSPDQTQIAIRARLQENFVRVDVVDQGAGIPSEYRERVFHRFARLDPLHTQAHYGAGLGLSVVKTIIEAHGGEVGVDAQTTGGAIFWFTLPLADEL
jgi:PAS domain S-box-containing protein